MSSRLRGSRGIRAASLVSMGCIIVLAMVAQAAFTVPATGGRSDRGATGNGPPLSPPVGPPLSPPVGPPLSPPQGPPLSPPVGPPLSPPVGPPPGLFDWEQPLFEYWSGCRELIYITGRELVSVNIRTGPSGNEHYTFTIVWDAIGTGQATGATYEVDYKEKLVANGWPPLTPPTSNIFTYHGRLKLEASDGSAERHSTLSHRTLLWDEETNQVKFALTFSKVREFCR